MEKLIQKNFERNEKIEKKKQLKIGKYLKIK